MSHFSPCSPAVSESSNLPLNLNFSELISGKDYEIIWKEEIQKICVHSKVFLADALSRRLDFAVNQTAILQFTSLVDRIYFSYSKDKLFKGLYLYLTNSEACKDSKEDFPDLEESKLFSFSWRMSPTSSTIFEVALFTNI